MTISHKTQRLWLALVLLVIAAACAPQAPAPLPTVALIPTDTRTFTPTITLTPSDTPTTIPTRTLTPIPPTPTQTLPPTFTFTISPTPSNTATQTFTPTDTFTPTATHTPRPTRTPSNTPSPTVLPVILSFTSDLPSVPSGGQDVLHWQTDADSVTLEMLTASGTVVSSNKVEQNGQLAVLVTSDFGSSIIYRLTAKRGKNATSRSLTINIQCATSWFFTPAPPGCPSQSPSSAAFKYQPFERGIALYLPTTNNVYLLANNGNRVNAYPNDWNYSPLPVLTPPAGFHQPTVEIGYIWLNKRWSDGATLDNILGWATADQLVYNGASQGGQGADLYVKGPTGAVYKLALAGVGTWSIVGNAP